MGIKTSGFSSHQCMSAGSEKPPHHMGIKTYNPANYPNSKALKNLPTTWGLRLGSFSIGHHDLSL